MNKDSPYTFGKLNDIVALYSLNKEYTLENSVYVFNKIDNSLEPIKIIKQKDDLSIYEIY